MTDSAQRPSTADIKGPSAHLEPDPIGREANARQHAVNAATGRAIDSPAFTVTAQEKAGDTVSPLESDTGATPTGLRERLEITNEHIGRLIHAFDGDRKELLRKLYKQNIESLAVSHIGAPIWKVFCPECKTEWSVDYRHPGSELCADCKPDASPSATAGNRTSEMSASEATRTEQMGSVDGTAKG